MAKRKRYTSEQIILKLREAEVLLGQEKTASPRCSAGAGFPKSTNEFILVCGTNSHISLVK